VLSPFYPLIALRRRSTTIITSVRPLFNQELPQHLIGMGLGLVGGAAGVVLAILLALVVQMALPPSVVFFPGLIPMMTVALLAGWGAVALLSRGVTRVSPHWFRGRREQLWQIASACATGTCLFQVVFFTVH
jgi:hypothetical protein